MNLTSNFDFCVELGISSVKEIFHLAFKSEHRYPHNVGPVTRNFSGREFTINVRVLDDEDKPADLSFQDDKHILFSFPFELQAQTADAPDPALSEILLEAQAAIPALLTAWDEDGDEVLGLSFFGITSADVGITGLSGVPNIGVEQFRNAVHNAYEAMPVHTFSSGGNTVTLYDGNRDSTLVPPNAATPYEIEVALETIAAEQYLKVTAPIHVYLPSVPVVGEYSSFGRLIFYRKIEQTDTSVTIDMTAEPTNTDLATTVELDNPHFASSQIALSLASQARGMISAFDVITEPAFTEAAAEQLLQDEVAAYIHTRRYPVYSPRSGDEGEPLSSPVGFLLVDDGILAILLNRRSGTATDDIAPDNFLGDNELALAVGAAKVQEEIQAVIAEKFPGVGSDGGELIETPEGDAVLYELNVSLADPGEHEESEGHLWISGKTKVKIDCWWDPTVEFEGPVFMRAHREDSEEGCELVIDSPVVGDFDFDQSCCDVFLEIIIPIAGWIALIVIEITIDRVGGEVAEDIANEQGAIIEPIPPVVNGIAEITSCLTGITVFRAGFVFPGELSIRRLSRSAEDLRGMGRMPRPDP